MLIPQISQQDRWHRCQNPEWNVTFEAQGNNQTDNISLKEVV